MDSQGYREGLLHVRGLIRQQNARRWLYQGSRSYIATTSDQKWIVEALYPLLAHSGLSRFAVVVSEDVFAQAIAEALCRKSSAAPKGTAKMRSFPARRARKSGCWQKGIRSHKAKAKRQNLKDFAVLKRAHRLRRNRNLSPPYLLGNPPSPLQ